MGQTFRRSRALRARKVVALVGAVGAVAALTMSTSSTAGAADPFEKAYAARTRVICHLPASGDAQFVHGFDTGHSLVYNGKAYWAIGDSLIDGNKDGWANDRLGFRTGTIGGTSDLNAEDCVDNVTYRTNALGKNVIPILTPDKTIGECLIWPGAPFEANGKLLFFYTSVHRNPDCGKDLPTTYDHGLGQITAPGTTELAPVKVVPGGLSWGNPVKAGARIYLFKVQAGELKMARVRENRVADVSAYEYWDGSQWVDQNPEAAASVADGVKAGVSIRYNAFVGRYLMVYSCGYYTTDVCARTAQAPGPDQSSLFGGWNEPTSILQCPAFGCGHGFWHDGYTDPAHPERIYVSTAHWAALGSRQYFVNLYSIDLSDQPAPATRVSAIAERDFGKPDKWQYASYDASKPGAALTTLATPTTSPAAKTITGFPAVGGTETQQGAAAPGVFHLGMYPSETKGAGRVWTAPADGVVELSGEAWRESTKADGSAAEILIVRGDSVITLFQKALPRKWGPDRIAGRVHLQNVPVQAGDRVVFGVQRGLGPKRQARFDTTFFLSSVTFDAA
jgi:hypothetical protein